MEEAYLGRAHRNSDDPHSGTVQVYKAPYLRMEYDRKNDILEIEGIKYQGELFRQVGGAFPLGEPLMFLSRADGVVSVYHFRDIDAAIVEAKKVR